MHTLIKVTGLFSAVFAISLAFVLLSAAHTSPALIDPPVDYFTDARTGFCFAKSTAGMSTVPCTQEVMAIIVFRGNITSQKTEFQSGETREAEAKAYNGT